MNRTTVYNAKRFQLRKLALWPVSAEQKSIKLSVRQALRPANAGNERSSCVRTYANSWRHFPVPHEFELLEKKKPRSGGRHLSAAIAKAPLAKENLTVKSLTYSRKQLQLPDLPDQTNSGATALRDFRVRWVASRCRVSLATANAIIANAGFSDGERRR